MKSSRKAGARRGRTGAIRVRTSLLVTALAPLLGFAAGVVGRAVARATEPYFGRHSGVPLVIAALVAAVCIVLFTALFWFLMSCVLLWLGVRRRRGVDGAGGLVRRGVPGDRVVAAGGGLLTLAIWLSRCRARRRRSGFSASGRPSVPPDEPADRNS